jgi:hypothetical protein
MVARRKTTGASGDVVVFKRRTQKRLPRRLLESVPQDWDRWDKYAKLEGLNWSEFTRRALEQRCSSIEELERAARIEPALRQRLPGLPYTVEGVAKARAALSQKPAKKNGVAARTKKRAAGAAQKGSSRS